MDHLTGLIRMVELPVDRIRRLIPINRLEIATLYIPGYSRGTVESFHTDFLEVWIRPSRFSTFFFITKKRSSIRLSYARSGTLFRINLCSFSQKMFNVLFNACFKEHYTLYVN